MICKFCGNEIDDGSDFCFICGQKVEPEAPEAQANPDVYSQPEQSDSATPVAEQPAAPVDPQEAPVAPATPAQPGNPVQPGVPDVPAEPVKLKKNGKPKNPANGFLRFICVICPILGQLIGLGVYRSSKKKNRPNKAVAVLNSTMRGVCLWLAVVVIVMFKKFVLG